MKEQIMDSIGRIDDELIGKTETLRKRKTAKRGWMKWAVPAACACLAVGLWAAGNRQPRNMPTAEATEEGTKSAQSPTKAPDPAAVIWADNAATEDNGFAEWEGKSVGFGLLSALEAAGPEDVLAIRVRPEFDGSYTVQGKTLAEYEAEAAEERLLPDKLMQLLKEGGDLKYGTALYETGLPSGEKWAQSLYEERIAYYGSAILEKYVVNGEFLADKLQEDIRTAEASDEAQKAYVSARRTYLTKTVSKPAQGAFPAEIAPDGNTVILFLTKEAFAAFRPEGKCFFSMASRNETATADFAVTD